MDHVRWDAVTACPNSPRDTCLRDFRRRQPEKQQGHSIAGCTACSQQSGVAASCTSGLEGKALSCLRECLYPLQHQTPGFDGSALRIERREAARDLVSVDELDDLEILRQQKLGGGRL